jgi:glutaredoxin
MGIDKTARKLKGAIMAKSVTIYTRTTCASCSMVKKFLDLKQQPYEVVNLDTADPSVTDAVVTKSGARTVPVIFVTREDDSEDITIGWNPGKLASAIA